MKTTAKDVKEVLDKYIEENKKEFENDGNELKSISAIESMAGKLVDCCAVQDLSRKGVENDSNLVFSALLRGLEYFNEKKK